MQRLKPSVSGVLLAMQIDWPTVRCQESEACPRVTCVRQVISSEDLKLVFGIQMQRPSARSTAGEPRLQRPCLFESQAGLLWLQTVDLLLV